MFRLLGFWGLGIRFRFLGFGMFAFGFSWVGDVITVFMP